MNSQGKSIIGRRGIVMSLAAAGLVAGVMWFGMLNGVGTASADGGPNSGTHAGQAAQQYDQQPPVNTCFLAIPCW